jgi:hypothetical protein
MGWFFEGLVGMPPVLTYPPLLKSLIEKPSTPFTALILRCGGSRLGGSLQGSRRWLEPSFEATASRWHFRTRAKGGPK